MMLMQEETVREFINRLPPISYEIPTVHLILLAVRSRFAKMQYDIKIKDLVVERKVIRPSNDWKETYQSCQGKLILYTGCRIFSRLGVESAAI